MVGTLKDARGAVVSGARVELAEASTQTVQAAAANDAGQYVFTIVQPGTYTLTATASGFNQAVVSAVTVEVAKSTLVDITLEVGEVSSTVNITAGTELQTVDSTLGEVVNTKLLQELPTVTRRVVELIFLQVATQPNQGNANISGASPF